MNAYENKDPRLILRMTQKVLQSIFASIGIQKAESGGMLGGKDGTVTHYHFDKSSSTSAVTYSPDHMALNTLLKEEWNPAGIRLVGFAHSHPGKGCMPSAGDRFYAEKILNAIDDLDHLWLPIINTVADTREFILTPWFACKTEEGVVIRRGQVEIISSEKKTGPLETLQPDVPLDRITLGKKEPVETKTFDRVKDAYDLSRMYNTRIIAAGAGGAAEWLEQLARAGISQFVLIDPDFVSETNLATQQVYRKDIGRPKVDCIAERIRDINPQAYVIPLQKKLEDLEADQIEKLIAGNSQTILCGLTDNFFAQARINEIALNYGIPSLCAQVYKEGRGAEITFTYPGVTPACHRCILSSRYRYFLEEHNENDVTSHGTPIFATAQLNAVKGFLALAMIHHGSDHPRWGNTLKQIGNRNLIQLRLDPDFSDTMGLKVFDRVFEGADKTRLFFGEPVWLPQQQECLETGYPSCPDCGGTGDLRNAIGTLSDRNKTTINTEGKNNETVSESE
ncbi:Molybdopterin-synthase adenylyltransferase [Pontiella desulfatans]|uniref:Molybdopterin-synthase adenylyltransferase n=1 Tax=Pontiella desulfatans TaxID=2750659 RepID=A0A6C2U4Q7_PONDE|nr:ThiF family adenylyltransferase [Pontiella desulfatans]VGO15048.1 Molybdopterin-synthase adenylyltransferase [Pontiella desulfatans]